MARFLTPIEKAGILDRWEMCKDEYADHVAAGDIEGDPGGQGYPDPAIYDFCDALNAIEGICTIQSCSGHRIEQKEKHGWHEDGPHCWKGHIWVRLDRTMRDLYILHSGRLSLRREIEVVALILGHFGGDTADIVFDGLDVEGTDEEKRQALVRSERIILRFFEQIRAEADDEGV